ncbi:hypothetical protein OQA88_3440 [Cercophora sp. LCS_1]
MPLLTIPPEIRNMIYAECLTWSEPMVMQAEDGPETWYGITNPPLKWDTEHARWLRMMDMPSRLCPKILRLNKQIRDEALPFLYSHNRFVFPSLYCASLRGDNRSMQGSTHLSPWFHQMGGNAKLIRHVSMRFPGLGHLLEEIHPHHITALSILETSCPGLETIAFRVWPDDWLLALGGADPHRRVQDVVDEKLRPISSLKEVVVDFHAKEERQVLGGEGQPVKPAHWPEDRNWTFRTTKVRGQSKEEQKFHDVADRAHWKFGHRRTDLRGRAFEADLFFEILMAGLQAEAEATANATADGEDEGTGISDDNWDDKEEEDEEVSDEGNEVGTGGLGAAPAPEGH